MLNSSNDEYKIGHSESTPLVFAIVGMSGSGKSEVVSSLAEFTGGEVVYFGGVVIEEIEKQGRKVTEESEAEVRMKLRYEYGMEAMAVLRLPQILDAVNTNKVAIIDGVYSYSEFSFLKEKLGTQLIVIAVHAPFSMRVERLANRLIRPLSINEIGKRDKREIETMEKGGPIAVADFHLVNDGQISDLKEALKNRVLERLGTHFAAVGV